MSRKCLSVFLFVVLAWLTPGFAHAIDNAECFSCHETPGLSKTTADGTELSLYVDPATFEASVHGGGDCTFCHSDITELPHPETLKPVACGECHEQAEIYNSSLHGKALARGDEGAASCDDCHGKHDIRMPSDPLSTVHPRNLPATCGKCHSDPTLVKSHMISLLDPSKSYLKSTHAKAVASGNLEAATCTDCHGTHDLQPAQDPQSKVYRTNIPETCGTCHPEELSVFKESIHGKALAAGIKDAPTCIDCHGEHDIESPDEATSNVNPRMAKVTCGRCHDDVRIMQKYGVETSRQASYMDSYHGLASAAGSNVVATCSSCHGAHNILPASDPKSSVNHENLPETCGKCHENAGPNFAMGAVHIMPTDPGQKWLGVVRLAYMWLIAMIIGGMVVHNTLMMIRRAMNKFREELYGTNTFRRFTRGMTIGHMVLTVSFITLALSGFALRYPEAWWARHLFPGEAGLAARGVVHRIAALFLVALAAWNGGFLLFTKAGRAELGHLMMRFKDVKDIFHNLAFIFGFSKTEPRYDRYSYIEKAEYWGMWWGTMLMIVTGFSMWFVNIFLQFLPKLFLDIVALVHFYEAWLAILTIVVWHLYYMIFDPETYPMNWSWITGKITMDDLKERHPLEYERLMQAEEPAAEPESSRAPAK